MAFEEDAKVFRKVKTVADKHMLVYYLTQLLNTSIVILSKKHERKIYLGLTVSQQCEIVASQNIAIY